MPPDLQDVKGQLGAKRALEIAAAGGHSLLMVGPPGSGKSMLAHRLSGLLPPLDEDDALANAAVAGLSREHGMLQAAPGLQYRVMRAPHHSASAVALVGGGSPPRPGEVGHRPMAACCFWTNCPSSQGPRWRPCASPWKTASSPLPGRPGRPPLARFQLVAAMNPCPCGWLGASNGSGRSCRCSPEAVARYQGKLSGPLLDRIDLQVEVLSTPPEALLAAPDGEPSAAVALRVGRARQRQLQRQGCTNAQLDAAGVHPIARCTRQPRVFWRLPRRDSAGRAGGCTAA